ncbi:MAG: hypothetical protein NT127_07480, partial [Sphingobacteriales bacterium]|nr:hypothetical protein [Sphingobacteriales bacterium]
LKQKDVFVSYSTLSRLFQLTNQQYQSHISTLDHIARAIGFLSYDHFVKLKKDESLSSISLKQAQMHLSLLSQHATPLKSALFFTERIIESEINYCSLAQQLAKQLLDGNKKNEAALKFLGSSSIGRKHFFQYYIDEDDISGMYSHAINNYFVCNSNDGEEFAFSKLYYLRKLVLKNPNQYKHVNQLLEEIEINKQHFNNLHLYSRWAEVKVLSMYAKHKKIDEPYLKHQTQTIINYFKTHTPSNEVIASIGRWNRALALTGQHNKKMLPELWLKVSINELLNGFKDLEFLSPTYFFYLNKMDLIFLKILYRITSGTMLYLLLVFFYKVEIILIIKKNFIIKN